MGKRIGLEAIISHYREGPRPSKRNTLSRSIASSVLGNSALGLGDTIVLTDLPRAACMQGRAAYINSASEHFSRLIGFNPFFIPCPSSFDVDASRLVQDFDCGNGHFIQRIQRAYGLRPSYEPKGCIELTSWKVHGRTVLHFEPGPNVINQRRMLHPRAREIYPEYMNNIKDFILNHPEMDFLEVGNTFSGLAAVRDCTGLNLEDTIRIMSSAEYFLGINSGPMHIAAALGLRAVVIINFPSPNEVVLPVLCDVGSPELLWLYPQNVHLHEDGMTQNVRAPSTENLERAFNGELYPYWSNEYLALIDEV